MSSEPAVIAEDLHFTYGERTALDGVAFSVDRGTSYSFLGPNGSGKSTLFRLLSTLVPLQRGSVRMLGLDLARESAAIRRRIGVVFQSPAVDKKLTVLENLRYGGAMLGLSGRALAQQIEVVLAAARLQDRGKDRVEELSGGLRRRVEIAKCLLGSPEIVLLDEASTGLDPVARTEMWDVLRAQENLTVLFTTHLMEEAAEADQLMLLDVGHVVAQGSPAALVREVGGQVLEIESERASDLLAELQPQIDCDASVVDGTLHVEGADVHKLIPLIMQQHGDRVQRLQLSHPSLHDVFLHRTGKRFPIIEPEVAPVKRGKKR